MDKIDGGVLSNVIAFLALAASAIGLIFVWIANKTSRKALEHSVQAFTISNRPYIIINIIENAEKKSYYRIEKNEKDNSVTLIVNFEMKNVGKIPAINIKTSNKLMFGSNLEDIQTMNFILPPAIALGPDQTFTIHASLTLKRKDKTIEEIIEFINAGFNFYTLTPFTYTSILEPERYYQTTFCYEVSANKATLVRYSMT